MFENTHSLPIIDTNRRRGIIPERLSVNRRIGIDLRREYSSLYSLRWEIERTFSILEEIMRAENIWYIKKRSYDTAIGLKSIENMDYILIKGRIFNLSLHFDEQQFLDYDHIGRLIF